MPTHAAELRLALTKSSPTCSYQKTLRYTLRIQVDQIFTLHKAFFLHVQLTLSCEIMEENGVSVLITDVVSIPVLDMFESVNGLGSMWSNYANANKISGPGTAKLITCSLAWLEIPISHILMFLPENVRASSPTQSITDTAGRSETTQDMIPLRQITQATYRNLAYKIGHRIHEPCHRDVGFK